MSGVEVTITVYVVVSTPRLVSLSTTTSVTFFLLYFSLNFYCILIKTDL